MEKIEYRFLQLVLSHLSDDRVTVAILHWDGQHMRTARSFAPLKLVPEGDRDHIKRTISAKVRSAEKAARRLAPSRSLFGLNVLYPVRSGLGASLFWSKVHSDTTRDAEAHFHSLKELIGLVHEEDSPVRPVTNREIGLQLQTAVARLQIEAPERVLLGHSVRRLQAFVPPVSWKNGVWHHILPFSLDVADEKEIVKRVRDLAGIVQLCIPEEHVPVPVVVFPKEPVLQRIAREEARIPEQAFPKLRIMEARHDDDELAVSAVVDMIQSDVRE